jgi:hypothetical protein
MHKRLLAVFGLILAAAPAQDPRGAIVGRVTDKSGAVVPNLDVRATNRATGVVAAGKTSSAGDYSIPFLLPGVYAITAETAGFKRFVREGIEVRTTESVGVDIVMELGAVSETVQVVAESPLLTTTDASQGTVIMGSAVTELPLLGGNPVEFALLDPAIMNETDMRARYASATNASSQWSSMGGGAYNNEFQIDGVSNTFADGSGHARVAFNPPQSAIGQFKIVTNPFDASAGNSVGATVNVSTRAGTNQWHGEGHFYGRNSFFDTTDFFSNKRSVAKTVYQDNRFGGSLGGPVRLPRIYNGRNRTFFFYTWEMNLWAVPQPFTGTVPTAAERAGDFSALLALNTATPNRYQIYDPFSTRPAPSNRYQRDPFPNNVIPKARFNPAGYSLANLYPLPNQPGLSDGENNYYNPTKSDEFYVVHLARFDHAFSEAHRVFVRVNYDFWEERKNKQYDNHIQGIVLNRINRGIALDDVVLLTPNLVLNVRYGFTEQDFPERRITRGVDLAALGFSPSLTRLINPQRATLPRVAAGTFSGYSTWETGDGTNNSLTHNFNANLSTQRGIHALRWGADFRVYRAFQNRYPYETAPDFAFRTTYTNGPLDSAGASPIGQDLASMLMGVVASGSMSNPASFATQNLYLGGYVQDDIKVAAKLTVNVGLRYELEWPMTERFDRLVTGFAFDTASPIDAQARAAYAARPQPEIPAGEFRVRGGLLFAGQTPTGRGIFRMDRNNFMPRAGLAWQISRRTTLRAGYGIFYGSLGVNATTPQQYGFTQSTPIIPTTDNGQTYQALASNPFPTGLLPAPGRAGGLSTYLGQSISFDSPNKKQAYSQRWTFAWQELLPSGILVETSYVGNRGTHLSATRQIDATPAQYLSKLLVRDQTTINYISGTVPNPLYGLGPLYTSTTISRANLLRPFPEFTGVAMNDSTGYSWYHSLQVRAARRMSHGVTLNAGYAFTKMMEAVSFLNESDAMPYETLSASHRPHRLTFNAVWELPFGRRRAWLNHLPKVLEGALGNWQLSGMVIRQAGPPLAWGNIIFNGDPNKIALPKDQRDVDRWFNIDAGFNKVSNQALSSNIRYFPIRLAGVQADGQAKWDVSLAKGFRLSERTLFRLRTQCYNLMNHANFAAPSVSPTSTAFGQITATAGMSRNLQVAATVTF